MEEGIPTKNKSLPKKKKQSQSSGLVFFFLGLIVGGLFVFFYFPHQEEQVRYTDKITPEVSKKSIINEIIAVTEIGNYVFTEKMFPQLKNEIYKKEIPSLDVLNKDDFWKTLAKEHSKEIEAINNEFKSISYGFYDQFTREELLDYLESKKSVKVKKIQTALLSNNDSLATKIIGLKKKSAELIFTQIKKLSPQQQEQSAIPIENTGAIDTETQKVPQAGVGVEIENKATPEVPIKKANE
jgi:hypothetical protein